MQFNMWRDYLGWSKLLEAPRTESEERPKPMTRAGVWDPACSQSFEDQRIPFPYTPRSTPNLWGSDVTKRATVQAPLTQLDDWNVGNPQSCGLVGQKKAPLHAPGPLKSQTQTSDGLYLPRQWPAEMEMNSLDALISQVDALDFTFSQACGPEVQKWGLLGTPRMQVQNSNTLHQHPWWSKFHKETLQLARVPKVDITDFPPVYPSVPPGEEAAQVLEERTEENPADIKGRNSWWTHCSNRSLLPGHRAQLGLPDKAPQNARASDSQERASLHRSRSEVGCSGGADNATQHTTSAEAGAFGIALPQPWGMEGQQEDFLQMLRAEAGARNISLSRPWWSDDQMEPLRLTPSPEMDVLDPATPDVWMPKVSDEVLLPTNSAARATTDSHPQQISRVQQQKKTSQVDAPTSELITPQVDATKASLGCAFCKHNGESKHFYSSHSVKDSEGNVQCPILRKYVCPQCQATGDEAHTRRFCPMTEKGYSSVYQYPSRNAAGKRNQKAMRLVPKN